MNSFSVPTNSVPVRVFDNYDSYHRFLPLVYGQYGASANMRFYSLCFDELQNSQINILSDFICMKLGFTGMMSLEQGSDSDYRLDSDVQSVDVTSYDITDWDFGPSKMAACNVHTSEVVVDCMTNGYAQDCLDDGKECSTDLDCCDQMYCSPVSGNCIDPVTCYLYFMMR